MKILNSKSENFDKTIDSLLSKRKKKIQSSSVSVKKIVEDVKKNGDKAVLKYEKRFSKNSTIIPSKKKISKLISSLDKSVKKAIDLAYDRIYKFHKLQKFKNITHTDKYKNRLNYKYLPIESCCIYCPGSSASYPSSVLMAAIPALVAKVKRIVLINPGYKGIQNPGVLYAAQKCKISQIYSIGGASGIAAVAYGTKKIKRVDKVVGPGNQFVTAAKKYVYGDVGIDGIAGPSEVTVVCDKTSNPEWIASDLIAQAEHGNFSECILISKDKKIIDKVKVEISKQLKMIPRASIAKRSLRDYGILMYINSNKKIAEVINKKIGPEHLEIHIKNYKSLLPMIKNAGSIALGRYAIMALTDYGAPLGGNHILPTNMSSRYSSGLGVSDFMKKISYVSITKKGIDKIGPSSITLANYEGLAAHAKSIEKRMEKK